MKSILVRLFFILIILLSGCTTDVSTSEHQFNYTFIPGASHQLSAEYLDEFDVYSCTVEDVTIHVETSIYTEDTATAIAAKVHEDIRTLQAQDIALGEWDLYVVERLVGGRMQRAENALYCTADQIESGDYRVLLVNAYFDFPLPELWKLYGCTAYLFDAEADDAALKERYSDSENLDVLSLFVAYFHPDYASPEEMDAAMAAACSFARYVIENHGMDPFLNTDCNAFKQEWLNKIGSGLTYEDPYASTVAEYTVTLHDYYSFIIESKRGEKLYCRPIEGDMDTPAELREFLYEISAGMDRILSAISQDAPESYVTIMENYSDPVHIYFDGTDRSYVKYSGRQIHLNCGYAFFHEIMHLLIPSNYDGEVWRNEGICDYFYLTYFQPGGQKRPYYAGFLTAVEQTAQSKESHDALFIDASRVYAAEYGMPSGIEQFDLKRFYELMAKVQAVYLEMGIEHTPSTYRAYEYYGSIKQDDGNELPAYQTVFFTEYLIEQYGLDVFLKSCLNEVPFEEAFGVPYDEAKNSWMILFDTTDVNAIISDGLGE